MPKKIPERMCVACRGMKAKKELLRLVRTPEGQLIIDVSGKKSGRGAYICREESCINKARKSRAIERVLSIKVEEALWQELQLIFTQERSGVPAQFEPLLPKKEYN